MRETGIVDSVKDGEVTVKLKRHAACLGCRACSMGPGGDMVIKAITRDKVKVGDEVTVEIDSILLLKAIVMVYLLPTAAFLAGIFAGLEIAPLLGIVTHKEVFSIAVGICLLYASFFIARKYGIKRKEVYQATVKAVVK